MPLTSFTSAELLAELKRRNAHSTHSDAHGIPVRDAVAKAFDVPAGLLYSSDRTARVSEARFACYVLLRERGLSLNEIASVTGRKDHGSVIHGMKKAGFFLASYSQYQAMFEAAHKILSTK
jgi:chromosomal replication initiation ATPase DnaA